MSVGLILGGGMRFVRMQPRVVAIWTMIYCAIAMIGMVAIRPFVATTLAYQRQVAANMAAHVKTPPPFPAGAIGPIALFELLYLLLLVIAFAAVVRAVARPIGDRFAYLRVGMDELRLIGLGLILGIAAAAVEIVLIVAIVLIVILAGVSIGKTAGAVIAGTVGMAALCGALYLQVRLSLVGVFTILQRRIVIGPAWRATKGHFWLLFGVYLVLAMAFAAASAVVLALQNIHLLAAYLSLESNAARIAVQDQLARQAAGPTIGLIIQGLASSIVFTILGVITIGSMATAAIAWSADDESESAEVFI